MGYNTINHAELLAWCKLYQTWLTTHEVSAIFLLDDLYLEFQNEQAAADK